MGSDNDTYTVLLIDSNPNAATQLRDLLENKPYYIITTHNGDEGFELLLNAPEKYSAVILGSAIQHTKSIELLRRINSSSSIITVPVIMEATTDSQQEMERCIRAGARYYIPMPIDKNVMSQMIAAAIRDQSRYIAAEHAVLETKPLGNTLTHAEFNLKNLQESQLVANLLANECPNPRLAVVGITEMLINAIEHGNLGITYPEKTKLHEQEDWLNEIQRRLALPEHREKSVHVAFDKAASHINLRITDQGNGFNWKEYQTLDTKRVFDNHGRGIVMARSLAFESMIYHGNGNDVECIIPLTS